jgi:hypothetical protein
MRILLDENFPADFAALLVGHDASNVHTHPVARELDRMKPAGSAAIGKAYEPDRK